MFDPRNDTGPRAENDFHVNSVWVDDTGIYLSGLRTGALLHLNRKFEVTAYCCRRALIMARRGMAVCCSMTLTKTACATRHGTGSNKRSVTYDEAAIEFAGIDEDCATGVWARFVCDR